MLKKLINSIIEDLAEDKSISSLLLKAQVIAAKLGDKDFATWIQNEQRGYPNAKNLPEYRVVPAVVKADISIPYRGLFQGMVIPIDAIDDEVIVDCMSHMRVVQPLSELEMLCNKSENGSLRGQVPIFSYSQVSKIVSGNVEYVYQEFSSSSIRNVINVFKSKLLEFFLQLNQEMDMGFDFSTIEAKHKVNQIMNTTYNISAAIANIGDGTVNASNITNVIGDGNTISTSSISELKKILQQIDSLVEGNNIEYREISEELSAELSKPSPAKKILKRGFQALKGLAFGISTDLLVGKLVPLIDQALALL